jgi:hypothetical protein
MNLVVSDKMAGKHVVCHLGGGGGQAGRKTIDKNTGKERKINKILHSQRTHILTIRQANLQY